MGSIEKQVQHIKDTDGELTMNEKEILAELRDIYKRLDTLYRNIFYFKSGLCSQTRVWKIKRLSG